MSNAPASITVNYQQQFAQELPLIESTLASILSPEQIDPAPLQQAMRHGVLNGGKRFRPILTMACAQAIGSLDDANHTRQRALMPACAVELIHCYSLIHDDLPSMDNDDWRRGQPTVHKVYGDAMAILAGDALNALAFALISEAPDLSYETRLHMIQDLAWAASTRGLVNGQSDDMLAMLDPALHTEAQLLKIHHGKTAALITAACRLGAHAGHASPSQLTLLTQWAEGLGLVFQMKDDVLDVLSSSEELGKTVGKDQAQGKLTFVSIYGLDETQRRINAGYDSLQSILTTLTGEGCRTESLAILVDFVVNRRH